MATIPKRRSGRRGTGRTGGVINAGNVPLVRPSRDPGVNATPGAFGEIEASALQVAGAQVADSTAARQARLDAAAKRIQDQRDVLEINRTTNAFASSIKDEFDSLNKGEDFSLDETATTYAKQVKDRFNSLLSESKVSERGRIKLQTKMEELMFGALDSAAIHQTSLQNTMIVKQVQSDIDQIRDTVLTDPANLETALEQMAQVIEDAAPALSPDKEESFTRAGMSNLHEDALNTLIGKGAISDAVELLDDPRTRQALGPEKTPAIRERINKVIKGIADDDETKKAEAKVAAFTQLMGRAPDDREIAQMMNALPPSVGEKKGAEDAQAFIAEKKEIAEAIKTGAIAPNANTVFDEQGELTLQTQKTLSAEASKSLGGVVDVSGAISGLSVEEVQAAQGIAALAGQIMRQQRITDTNLANKMAVAAFSESGNLPKRDTFESVAREIATGLGEPKSKLQADALEVQEAAQFDKLQGKIDLDLATGIESQAVAAVSNFFGQFSEQAIGVNTLEARRAFKSLIHYFIISNKRSADGRFPIYEQKRMEDLIGTISSLRSGAALRVELRGIQNEMRSDIRDHLRDIGIASLPVKEKQDILAQVRAKSGFLKRLERFDLVSRAGDPKLDTVEAISQATPRDVDRYLQGLTDIEIESLPKDVQQAIIDVQEGRKVTVPGESEEGSANEGNEPPQEGAKNQFERAFNAEVQKDLASEEPAPIKESVQRMISGVADDNLFNLLQEAVDSNDPVFQKALQAEINSRGLQSPGTGDNNQLPGKKKVQKTEEVSNKPKKESLFDRFIEAVTNEITGNVPNQNLSGTKDTLNTAEALDGSNAAKAVKPFIKPGDDGELIQLASDEGFRAEVYSDKAPPTKDAPGNNPTIGFGFRLNRADSAKELKKAGIDTPIQDFIDGKAKLTPKQALELFKVAVEGARGRAKRLIPEFNKLSEERQNVLVNMHYQMGSILDFKKTLKFLTEAVKTGKQEDWNNVADEMLRSKWAEKQTPERANRLAKRMKNG